MQAQSLSLFDPEQHVSILLHMLTSWANADQKNKTRKKLRNLAKIPASQGGGILSQVQIIAGLQWIKQNTESWHSLSSLQKQAWTEIWALVRTKPTRTDSGVAPVAVLTKPWPCPGTCIFCPNDIRMPKSYVADEPGAQRALSHRFDPYQQTLHRLRAMAALGHPVDKVELLVLGGTWTSYAPRYQRWFIASCLRAMNDFSYDDIPLTLDAVKESIPPDVVDLLQNDINITVRRSLEQDELAHPDQSTTQLEDKQEYNQIVNTTLYKIEFSRKYIRTDDERDVSWEELADLQKQNEVAAARCVGMVFETRPDHIDAKSAQEMRRLGATKVQLGVQILDDRVSLLNERGETSADAARAIRILRQHGYKIQVHIMPNLYGATYQDDKQSYHRLFSEADFCPDEVKLYPYAAMPYTKLSQYVDAGKHQLYSQDDLTKLLAELVVMTPKYCRINRLIRDLPTNSMSESMESVSFKTNLRQNVEVYIQKRGWRDQSIRAREIRSDVVQVDAWQIDVITYAVTDGVEHFIQAIMHQTSEYATEQRRENRDTERLGGFARLFLPHSQTTQHKTQTHIPQEKIPKTPQLDEIPDEIRYAALLRELHVYGTAQSLATSVRENQQSEPHDDEKRQQNHTHKNKVQHQGLGTRLLDEAKKIAANAGYAKLSVISGVGVRGFYRQRGFAAGQLYQHFTFDRDDRAR